MSRQGAQCDWCGVELTEEMGYRLLWPDKSLGTAFCRLEHIVPFLMQKDQWHIWKAVTVPADAPARTFLRVSGPRVRDVDGLDG